MAATVLTPITKVGPYPTLPVTALSLDVAWTTGDAVNTNAIAVSGGTRYLLLMRNTHATLAKTVTIASVASSPHNRKGDITSYSIGAGLYSHIYFSSTDGWMDGNNQIVITPQTTDISFQLWAF